MSLDMWHPKAVEHFLGKEKTQKVLKLLSIVSSKSYLVFKLHV